MNKQIESIKQIATELGLVFEDDADNWQCKIKIPSIWYATDGDYIEDPSTVYIFRYDEGRITEWMCFDNLIFDTEHNDKLIWVGHDNYDPVVITFDDKEIKRTLTKCMKDLKEKEEEIKFKNLGRDFE